MRTKSPAGAIKGLEDFSSNPLISFLAPGEGAHMGRKS